MLPSMLTTNGLFESVAIFLTSFVLSFLSRPIRAVYFYYDVSTFATEGAVAISGRMQKKYEEKRKKQCHRFYKSSLKANILFDGKADEVHREVLESHAEEKFIYKHPFI